MSDLVTLAQVKAFRPIGSTTIPDFSDFSDEELQAILDDAESTVEMLTNNIFETVADTIYVDGSGLKELFLNVKKPYPIISITSVQEVDIDGTVQNTFTEGTDFTVEKYSLVLADRYFSLRTAIHNGVWPEGDRNIKVTGNWGMSSVPAAIKKAIKLLTIVNSLGPKYAGIGIGGSADEDIVQEEWSDYTVTYKGSTPSIKQREKGIQNLTGYIEIDRLLSPYINYANLFIAI